MFIGLCVKKNGYVVGWKCRSFKLKSDYAGGSDETCFTCEHFMESSILLYANRVMCSEGVAECTLVYSCDKHKPLNTYVADKNKNCSTCKHAYTPEGVLRTI